VASKSVVEKLGLETIPHAKPYKLTWISKEGKIDVNKQVLINFSIYMDEVLCNVVLMEATHLLLCRPYQQVFLSLSWEEDHFSVSITSRG